MPEPQLPTGTTSIARKDPERETYWEEEEQLAWDAELGAAAAILEAQDQHKAVALLLDVEEVRFVKMYEDWDREFMKACLMVSPYLVARFDDETCERIRSALEKACFQAEFGVSHVEAFPKPAQVGWREQMHERLTAGPRNQAALAPLPKGAPRVDGMAFRDAAELIVYRALKKEQEARPQDDTFTIVPNCAARVPHRTWEPDFLILFHGRCAVIEVDGGSHRGKYLNDKSRDEILQDAGVTLVRRIDTNDVQPSELPHLINRVLDRLANPR